MTSIDEYMKDLKSRKQDYYASPERPYSNIEAMAELLHQPPYLICLQQAAKHIVKLYLDHRQLFSSLSDGAALEHIGDICNWLQLAYNVKASEVPDEA